jgi:hypothetical protein
MEPVTVDDETAQDTRLARLGALLEAHRSVVIAALEEATEDHIDRLGAYCYDCGEGPDELCETHATDLERADEYRRTVEELRAALDH